MTWKCLRCTYLHDKDALDRVRCRICGSPRKWHCSSCSLTHELDDAKLSSCKRCGEFRNEPSRTDSSNGINNKRLKTTSAGSGEKNDSNSDAHKSKTVTPARAPTSPPPAAAASTRNSRPWSDDPSKSRASNLWMDTRIHWPDPNISSSNDNNMTSMESLEEWLKEHPPSRYSAADCHWIQVHHPDYWGSNKEEDNEPHFDPEPYQVPLNKITALIDAGKKVPKQVKQGCMSSLMSIAREQHYTTGKWMLFFNPSDPKTDIFWSVIAKAVGEGKLGCSAKIAPTKHQSDNVVCCIYTKDFADRHGVQRVLKAIQEEPPQGLNFKVNAGYKPDFLTSLNINSKNAYRLPAVIYKVSEAMEWSDEEK